MSSEDHVRQLARKLAAASVSHKAGHASIDYTLKHYAKDDEPIGDAWIELAKQAWAIMDQPSMAVRGSILNRRSSMP